MAADYWASTQRRHWQFTRESLAQIRESLEDEETDLTQQYSLPDRRLLSQFFAHQLAKLGKRLSVRQQALATAQVYMKRFYTKIEIRHTNPYLVVATALYLACKMEECPQHIRVVVSEARQTWPGFFPSSFLFLVVTFSALPASPPKQNLLLLPIIRDQNRQRAIKLTSFPLFPPPNTAESTFSDPANLGEAEFALISTLNSHLIIHHPYRSLSSLIQSFSHSQSPSQHQFSIAQDECSLAWSIINDHYLTDLPLLHPPHVIAVMAILLAMTLKPTPGGLTSSTAFPGSVAAVGTTAGAQLLMGSLPAVAAAARSGKEGNAGAGAGAQGEGVLSPQQRKVQGLVKWLAEGEVDIAAVVECSQEMISLYDVLDQYSEKACKEQIARFVKGRGLDK